MHAEIMCATVMREEMTLTEGFQPMDSSYVLSLVTLYPFDSNLGPSTSTFKQNFIAL